MPYQLNVESLDPQSFGVMDKAGRRTFPARFFPSAFGASDVRIEDFWTGFKTTIPLGSRVGGATPGSQAALITALRNVVGQQSVIDATMARLFVDQYGNQLPGVLYDPSDISTMFQGTNGEGAVTATGQSVGIVLDKARGMVRGGDVVLAGDFSSAGPWSAPVAGASITGGQLAFDGATSIANGAAITSQTLPVTVGQVVEVTYTIASGVTAPISVGFSGGSSGLARTAAGTFTDILHVSGTALSIYARTSTGARTGAIDNVSVKIIAGNHAYQTTSGSRPIYRDEIDGKSWELDGVDDWFAFTPFLSGFDAFSAVAVRYDTLGSDRVAITHRSSSSSNPILGQADYGQSGTLYRGLFRTDAGSMNILSSIVPGAAPLGPLIQVVQHVPAVGGRLRVNGVTTNQQAAVSGPVTVNLATLGANRTTATNSFLAGRIYSVVSRDLAASDAEMARVEAYLAIKGGVTL